ncbi:hypothetical protein MPTK1_1g02540 [Marchantia polymorpha subsp. ruderalis]|uniref:Uncharacterized protein n=2 Tax=Marchantia polymorpha TaxID=3197 RepID=A0AAF6AKR6_MARPO|nr:hypothetical protein MARPO_0113s0002 [Marchantia polymorpha]BBM97036.1 hypothetical protein Mp_1g02540 [Marchantia polymorpha subsp. ruderalis]|eukprot:PTQ31258.1 hypothetical protein MARPO_0113s0002 [Marchantia polymorpha]
MAAQVSEESNDRTSASADGEEKWTHGTRIDEELKRVAENMAWKVGAGARVAMPTIMRAPHWFRKHEEFGYEFRYDPVCMRLGLYNRGALIAPTAAETCRMEAAIAFVNKLNARRVELRLRPISWHEMCAIVVPSPARVRSLWSDAPSDMTDDDVRHLLAIDAVYLLCFFQYLGGKFTQVQALDPYEAAIWMLQGITHDFLLMENQIPLVLIQNALALALEGEHREHAELDRVINRSSDDDSSSVDFDVDERVDLVCAEDLHELLSSVQEDVLQDAGLTGFSDNFVPRSQIERSDHLLDFVYRVVATKSRTPDVDGDDNPRPGSNSTRSVGALIRCGEKSTYFFQKPIIYLRHLQCVLPTRLVAAFEMRLQSLLNREWQPLMEFLLVLKQLVDTMEDVVILCGNTDDYVIFNTLGDAGIVAKMINDLCRGCRRNEDSPRFVEFCKEVQQCYTRRRKRWLWQFVETYLNKPWKIASLLGAILLLVLTALQTIYSMLSFYGIQTLSD